MTMKANLADYTVNNDKLFGIYRGVVEDRKDPELLCRCRVRVLGVHDQLKVKDDVNGIPTEELPWAEPCYGLFEGSISGNGQWCVPLQGTYVFVFFENGNWMQPRFFCSAPGMPEEPPKGDEGFNDPEEEWPDKDWLLESDAHRLMKRDLLDWTSLLEVKLPEIDEAVPIALGGDWTEHPPMYQAEYPDNIVTHTHGGVYTEMDSTKGQERYHIYHPSNSYMEIGPTGNMTLRNNASRWDIVVENRFEHTMMSHHRTVNKNRSSKVEISEYEQIGENHYREIGNDDYQFILNSRYKDVATMDVLKVGNTRSVETGTMDLKYAKVNKSAYVGTYNIDWYNSLNDKYTASVDREIVGADKIKWVQGTEKTKVDVERRSFVQDVDLFECGDEIHLKAGNKIILEATEIEFRAEIFNDFAAETNIAGILTWSGIALGEAFHASTAKLAIPGTPVPIVIDIPAVAPEAPAPPESPALPTMPEDPADPPALPPPPAPPAPPELEYVDVPPEPDEC